MNITIAGGTGFIGSHLLERLKHLHEIKVLTRSKKESENNIIFEQTGCTVKEVAKDANLALERVEAILDGRWTPSPTERQKLATALDVNIEEVSWGHTMDPRNIRYRRYGLKEHF